MRANRSLTRRTILASLIGLGGTVWSRASRAQAAAPNEPRQPVAIQFALDRPIDAAAAPFVMAGVSGLFSAEDSVGHTNVV
jgi:NitT/TauT family transport system substrate-binding protein